jgi:hypothetical protein
MARSATAKGREDGQTTDSLDRHTHTIDNRWFIALRRLAAAHSARTSQLGQRQACSDTIHACNTTLEGEFTCLPARARQRATAVVQGSFADSWSPQRSFAVFLTHLLATRIDATQVTMVNVSFSPEGNPIYTQADGTEALYNLGDMAWVITATAREYPVSPPCSPSRPHEPTRPARPQSSGGWYQASDSFIPVC